LGKYRFVIENFGNSTGALVTAQQGETWAISHVGQATPLMTAGDATLTGIRTVSALLTAPLGLGAMPLGAVMAGTTWSLTRVMMTL